MIHHPSGGARGMASDIEIQYKEIERMKKELTEIYVKHNQKAKHTKNLKQAWIEIISYCTRSN